MLDFISVSDLRRASRTVLFFSVICLVLQRATIVSDTMSIASVEFEISRDAFLQGAGIALFYFLVVLGFRALQDLSEKTLEQTAARREFAQVFTQDAEETYNVKDLSTNALTTRERRQELARQLRQASETQFKRIQKRLFISSVMPDIALPLSVGVYALSTTAQVLF